MNGIKCPYCGGITQNIRVCDYCGTILSKDDSDEQLVQKNKLYSRVYDFLNLQYSCNGADYCQLIIYTDDMLIRLANPKAINAAFKPSSLSPLIVCPSIPTSKSDIDLIIQVPFHDSKPIWSEFINNKVSVNIEKDFLSKNIASRFHACECIIIHGDSVLDKKKTIIYNLSIGNNVALAATIISQILFGKNEPNSLDIKNIHFNLTKQNEEEHNEYVQGLKKDQSFTFYCLIAVLILTVLSIYGLAFIISLDPDNIDYAYVGLCLIVILPLCILSFQLSSSYIKIYKLMKKIH